MMRRKSITLFILAFLKIGGLLFAQGGIDYKDRSLLRKLERSDVSTDLKPLSLPQGASEAYAEQGKFFKSHASKDVSQIKYIYVGRVSTCRAGGCSSPGMGSSAGNSEFFDYFVVFDAQKEIERVRIYNYQATHGYEVAARGWLRQFNGYDGSADLKLNRNIDGITGATISAESIKRDVERISGILQSID
jgi:Na+-translocating ferredoxin:NAD+ oxidoreductase RnfG subunit